MTKLPLINWVIWKRLKDFSTFYYLLVLLLTSITFQPVRLTTFFLLFQQFLQLGLVHVWLPSQKMSRESLVHLYLIVKQMAHMKRSNAMDQLDFVGVLIPKLEKKSLVLEKDLADQLLVVHHLVLGPALGFTDQFAVVMKRHTIMNVYFVMLNVKRKI